MGTAGLNTALNALAASSLAAQGASTGPSSALTGAEPSSQFDEQSEIINERVSAASAHQPSARALQLRARPFADVDEPINDSGVSHLGGNALLSAAMMVGEAGSDGLFDYSFEESLGVLSIAVSIFFLAWFVHEAIKTAKVRSSITKLKSELEEIDWIGEHAGDITSHISIDMKRIENLHVDRAVEAVTQMPLSSSGKWELFKKIYIEQETSAERPFFFWAGAQGNAQILGAIAKAMNESGYSPEEVLEIADSLLSDEEVILDYYVVRDIAAAIKTLKEKGYSVNEAISALKRWQLIYRRGSDFEQA